MNYNPTVFVYMHINTGEIKAEYINEARLFEGDKKWLHIATLEPKSYINSLLVEYPSLVRRLKGSNV